VKKFVEYISQGKVISVIIAVIFFVSLIIMDQVIAPTDRASMFLVCLRMGSIFALLAVSMNLLNGFTGLFSLGHAGFMLIGAYTYAIFAMPLAERYNVYRYFDYAITFSFPEFMENAIGRPGIIIGMIMAIIFAGLVTAFFAFLIGLPVLRLKSDYLAIATIGFAEIIRTIIMWRGVGPITNAANPLRSFTRIGDLAITIGGTRFPLATFSLTLMAGVCIFIIALLVKSSYGRAFKAIREDEIAAEAMGINLFKHKQWSFCISSFFTGVGGALLAIFTGVAMAGNFTAAMTYEFLLIVVLGGIGSISGSILGAMLFVFASQWWLRGLDSGVFMGISAPLIFRSGFRLVVFSVIIMCVVLFFRRGLMGDKELPYYLKKWKEKFFTRKTKPEAGVSDA